MTDQWPDEAEEWADDADDRVDLDLSIESEVESKVTETPYVESRTASLPDARTLRSVAPEQALPLSIRRSPTDRFGSPRATKRLHPSFRRYCLYIDPIRRRASRQGSSGSWPTHG